MRIKQQKEIEKLKNQLLREKQKKDKYKKRFQRLSEKHESPHCPVNSAVHKSLLFNQSLVDTIRQKYANTKKQRVRQTITSIT